MDINGFATRSAPFLGLKTYTPPTPDRLGPWSLIDAECDGATIRYDEIESNAVAMPCEEGPMIIWDKEFFAEMSEEYGTVVNAQTIAHETGHVVLEQYDEAKNPDLIPGFVQEQFADCFAGAYVNEARSRSVDTYMSESALDSLFEAMYFAGDLAPGLPQASVQPSDVFEPDQHGLGFDRLRTFDLGFRGGIVECAKYLDEQPKRVASTLVLGRDGRAGREVTIAEMIDLVAPTLKAFAALHPEAVGIDRVGLNRLYASDVDSMRADYGDGIVLWALATESVADTQARSGEDDFSAKNLEYQACWFGAWVAWLGQGNAETIRLSETDLDGSLYAVLAYADVDENSSISRHLSATLAGYRDGVERCDT